MIENYFLVLVGNYERFSFIDYIEELDEIGYRDWITVYKSEDVENIQRVNIITALVSKTFSKEIMSHAGWSLNLSGFKSGFVHYADKPEKYFRNGIDVPLEPLVLERFFNSIYLS